MAIACGYRAGGFGFDSRPRRAKKPFADVGNLLNKTVLAGL